jgi:signal transduction histidine kinase
MVAAGVLATALTAWWTATSPTFVDPAGLALWRSVIIASYWAVGVFTWWRRPQSRLGGVILLLTILYVAQAAVGSPVAIVYTLGMVEWAVSIVYTAYVFLCFPTGDLESALDRWFIRSYWLTTAVVWALILALSPTLPPGGSFVNCGTSCPPNALQIVGGHAAAGAALTTAFQVQFTVALIGLAALIVSKARSSSTVRRRAVVPLAVAFLADIVEFVIALFVLPSYPDTAGAFKVADGLVTLAVPVAILIGQIKADRFAAMTLSQIALGADGNAMTPAKIQSMIGDALGDPILRLALWDPDRSGYVDVYGVHIEIPKSDSTRRVTQVTRDDQPVAALIHDAALDADTDLVAGLTATALTLLENTRLVDELHESRARIVRSVDRERKRLERDLHDGAQQRLVAIQAYLGMARELTERGDVKGQLDSAAAQADSALNELRALSHGVYPTDLRDFGLAVAIRGIGVRSPLPVRVVDSGISRLPDATETAIYFCVREAIQNTAKHAGPGAAVTVTLTPRENAVEFTVSDTGAGITSMDGSDGMGIMGMRDRIASLGGWFHLDSAPGAGTSVHATIPVTEPTRQSQASPNDETHTSPSNNEARSPEGIGLNAAAGPTTPGADEQVSWVASSHDARLPRRGRIG